MKLLLDTHAFIWFVSGSDELSKEAKKVIKNGQNVNYLSIASLWEMSIKIKLHKLDINGTFESVIDDVIENDIKILPINFSHTVKQYNLNFFHRDPFDRIIISQAIVEKMNIISKDKIFEKYIKNTDIKRIW